MKILQKLPYKLKTALPILAFVGASIVPAACNNDDDDHYDHNDNDKTDSKHDVELLWTARWTDETKVANIQKHLDDPNVNNIYLRFVNMFPFSFTKPQEANYLRQRMEWRIALDPKRVHGRGNLIFLLGLCAKEDSLWFVEHGWTVNTPYTGIFFPPKPQIPPQTNTTQSTKQR